jgi:DNA-binding PadR family transcriptional regulator
LLGLLRRRAAHGYKLNDLLGRELEFLIDLKKPTAYLVLDRLSQEGYVSAEAEREGNRPERRVYRITPKGNAHFLELLRENLATFNPPHFPDEIGLDFLDALPAEEARELLRRRLAVAEERLASFRPQVEIHRGIPAQLVLEHYVAHLETDRAWILDLLRRWEDGNVQLKSEPSAKSHGVIQE